MSHDNCEHRPCGEAEIHRLRSEVERLRGLIAEVEAGPEWRGERCPWCGASVDAPTHAPDCPAFSARGEVRR